MKTISGTAEKDNAKRNLLSRIETILFEWTDAAIEDAERTAAAGQDRFAVGADVAEDEQEVSVRALADVGRGGVADGWIHRREITSKLLARFATQVGRESVEVRLLAADDAPRQKRGSVIQFAPPCRDRVWRDPGRQ